jgi:autotransporter-associated beta strand protein
VVLGGLVGQNYYGGIISNSYATGNVTESSSYNPLANYWIGGLVGLLGGDYTTITNSYAFGVVSQPTYPNNINNINNVGSIFGTTYIGTLVGKNTTNPTTNPNSISADSVGRNGVDLISNKVLTVQSDGTLTDDQNDNQPIDITSKYLSGITFNYDGLSGAVSIAVPFTILSSERFNVLNSSGILNLSGVISGLGNLIASGPGKLNLTNTNTYTGTTTINAGATLGISDANTLGSIANTSAIYLKGTISSPATLTISPTSPTQNVLGSGLITVANGKIQTNSSVNIDNNLIVSDYLKFDLLTANTTTTIRGSISGSGGIKVNSYSDEMDPNSFVLGNTLELTQQNTYTGSTIIFPYIQLSLTGSGTISDSHNIYSAGAFDISGITPSGTSIKNIYGNGITLGDKTITFTDAGNATTWNGTGFLTGSFVGSTDSGIIVNGGTLTISGNQDSQFVGSIRTAAGASLVLKNAGSISRSSLVNNGTFDISGLDDLST